MLSIHCKIALFFLFPSLACPPFWKFVTESMRITWGQWLRTPGIEKTNVRRTGERVWYDWIGGTASETGFHSVLFASFYQGEDPSGTLVELSSLASRERSQQVSHGNLGGNLRKYRPSLRRVMTSGNSSFCLLTNHFILSQIYEDGTIEQPFLTRNWVSSPFNTG